MPPFIETAGESDLLEATHLSKRFGTTTALDDVTLRVEPGEIYCLLGANGAGKTTLINMFLNFLDPTGGEVRINGRDVTRRRSRPSATSPTSPSR